MKHILITGAKSFVGTSIERFLLAHNNSTDSVEPLYIIDTVDTINNAWKQADYTKYDTVFHVAGIAHVDPKPEMAPLYYKINRDLAIEVAKYAKEHGVKQFIYMSSKIVYHASKSLNGDIVTKDTVPNPNDFYGDSKLQAEKGLKELACNTFKIAIIRPPMIYGPTGKGNLQRLAWLATKTPVFPAWHNKRSMLAIDNLAEFVKQLIDREMEGIFYPQNKELVDTVDCIRYFAKLYGKKIWITRLLNPFVWLTSFFLPQIPKMFSDSYYDLEMSKYDFNYNIVSFEESLKGIKPKKTMR